MTKKKKKKKRKKTAFWQLIPLDTEGEKNKKKCDRDEMFAIVHPFLVLKGLQFEIRTRASEEIRALTVRLRPLGHPIVMCTVTL